MIVALSAHLLTALNKLPQCYRRWSQPIAVECRSGSDLYGCVEEEAKAHNDQFIAVDLLVLAMAKSTASVGKLLKQPGLTLAQSLGH